MEQLNFEPPYNIPYGTIKLKDLIFYLQCVSYIMGEDTEVVVGSRDGQQTYEKLKVEYTMDIDRVLIEF